MNNIKVFLRIRPFNERETKEGSKNCLVVDYKNHSVLVKKPKEKSISKENMRRIIQLDYIFPPNAAQVSYIY